MKKLFLSFVFVFAFSTMLLAQWGAKGGLNFSKFTGNITKLKAGFHIGVTYDFALSQKFYFQPGLLFISKGTKFDPSIFMLEGDVSVYGLELPLLFSFRPKISEQVKLITNFGLYANYGLFGSKRYEYEFLPEYGFEYERSTVKGDPFDAYNRFDIGIPLGIGLQYNSFTLSGEYLLGFANAEKETLSKNWALRISLGYIF